MAPKIQVSDRKFDQLLDAKRHKELLSALAQLTPKDATHVEALLTQIGQILVNKKDVTLDLSPLLDEIVKGNKTLITALDTHHKQLMDKKIKRFKIERNNFGFISGVKAEY